MSLIPALRRIITVREMFGGIGSICKMDAAVSDSNQVKQNFILFKS
jgi:hypothetical protein